MFKVFILHYFIHVLDIYSVKLQNEYVYHWKLIHINILWFTNQICWCFNKDTKETLRICLFRVYYRINNKDITIYNIKHTVYYVFFWYFFNIHFCERLLIFSVSVLNILFESRVYSNNVFTVMILVGTALYLCNFINFSNFNCARILFDARCTT